MFSRIPPILQARSIFYERYFQDLEHPLSGSLHSLLVISDYARRHIDVLQTLLKNDSCLLPLTAENYYLLAKAIPHQSEERFASALRQFRHEHLLRIALQELSGITSTEDSMLAWSNCADAIISRTLSFCQCVLLERYGEAYEDSGSPARLYVLAMGKLGGRELNFSSDIDLIIAFSASGHTRGSESISNAQYYTKVVQRFIHILQDVTQEGFVFRVDLRLRPNGDSGALVSSVAAMETYYQEQGRDWERYAMVKARIIPEESSDLETIPWFHRLITPFVYRRYVDFSVIESLRSMKSMIEREVQLNPRLNDIKRGLGGIREVEFILQSIQLIRGGRSLALQQQNAIKTLMIIQQERFLPRMSALKQAYLFLRRLENFLQIENDKQTHELPLQEEKQAQIAFAMGYASWEKLLPRLQQFQRIISTLFHSVLRKANDDDTSRLLTHQLLCVWQGHVEHNMAVNVLTMLGYKQAERCYQLIYSFRHAPRCRRLNQVARIRLDRFMVLLLSELAAIKSTDSVLLQVIRLLENIIGRSAYLALLTENPNTLKELLYWFTHSPFISALIVEHPFLLENLLDQQSHWQPISKLQLEKQLSDQLLGCEENDAQDDVLRQFKLNHWLLAARAELSMQIDEIRIGRFLADLAEVIVTMVVALACQQLQKKSPNSHVLKSKFAIIAYGKLGSREMNYHSDLDLVFIHNFKVDEEGLVTRLTKKILHALTTRSQSGVLYEVDTRLRPSGDAGLLVSTIAAFIEYQKNQAWTWEHQALIRGRVIVGSQSIRQSFRALKKAVFLVERSREGILHDIIVMRDKMSRNGNQEDIKQLHGGLIDLEFLVQFLVLVNPLAGLARYTHTLSLLQQLTSANIISSDQFYKLRQAYRHFHKILHQGLLCPGNMIESYAEQADVRAITQEIYTCH